jgi:glycosylphosphatidylinositol transamidase (GPIT) subunit GPI8
MLDLNNVLITDYRNIKLSLLQKYQTPHNNFVAANSINQVHINQNTFNLDVSYRVEPLKRPSSIKNMTAVTMPEVDSVIEGIGKSSEISHDK